MARFSSLDPCNTRLLSPRQVEDPSVFVDIVILLPGGGEVPAMGGRLRTPL
jgi:hypothetical protein